MQWRAVDSPLHVRRVPHHATAISSRTPTASTLPKPDRRMFASAATRSTTEIEAEALTAVSMKRNGRKSGASLAGYMSHMMTSERMQPSTSALSRFEPNKGRLVL